MFIGKMEEHQSILNVASINRSASRNSQSVEGENQKPFLGDRLNVSAKGKNQSIIEQLMKQKELIQESKRSAIDSAAENGTGDISHQLDAYDQQLKELDEQIARLQTEQVEEDTKKAEDKETGIYEKPTANDAQTETLNDITKLTAASDKAEVIASVQEKLDGRVRVLESEIKSGVGNIKAKMEKVPELKSKSRELTLDIADKLSEVINDSDAAASAEKKTESSDLVEKDVPVQAKSEDAEDRYKNPMQLEETVQ